MQALQCLMGYFLPGEGSGLTGPQLLVVAWSFWSLASSRSLRRALLWVEGYPAPRKLEKIGSSMSGVWVDTTYMYFVVLQLQI